MKAIDGKSAAARQGMLWRAALCALPLMIACAVHAEGRVGPRDPDPCQLLSDEDVENVQGQPVAQRLPTEMPNAEFRTLQCAFRTKDIVRSVSVALAVPAPGVDQGIRQFWNENFHPAQGFKDASKVGAPRPIEDLGDEAYWVANSQTGVLYVLKGERFLRLSVGGEANEEKRRERSVKLAERALARLETP